MAPLLAPEEKGTLTRPRAAAADGAALAGLALLYGLGHAWFFSIARFDSDRHFHFAVSRLVSWWGRLATLPQVEDLGWAKKFPDKEYLFHVFTGWGYRAAGEAGVEAVCALLALVAIAGLYALCRTATSPGRALLFTAAAALANATFLYRLQMIRPQVLAIGATLWLGVALASRRPRLAAVAGAVFALGYHALYVPLAVLACFAWVQRRDRRALEAAALGAGGLAAGVLLNPAFPGNLTMLVAHAGIAFGAAGAKESGTELLSLSSAELLRQFAGPLLVMAAAVARPWWLPFPSAPSNETRERACAATWVGLALAFWGLTCITPRAAEYAVPLTAVAGAQVFRGVSWRWTAALAALATALSLPAFKGSRAPTPSDRYAAAVATAVAKLPADAAGKKVLNCAFDEGSVLLDLRPDVRVVDVLSPELLEQTAPQLTALRHRLQEGTLPDAAAVVRESFHADYVLCGYPKAVALLEADPRFVRLSPPPGEDPPGPRHELFALAAWAGEAPLVRRFEVANPQKPGTRAGFLSPPQGWSYLDLPRGPPRDAAGCVGLGVPAEDVTHFAGADLVLLGGGPLLSLMLNGDVVFAAQTPFEDQRWNSLLVPLPKPLAASDQLSLKVCPAGDQGLSGAAVSLWTWAQVTDWCARVGKPLAEGTTLAGAERATCLAPLAVRPARPE